jgi:MFS family permease
MDKIWNKKFILLFITNLLMMATFYAAVPIIPVYCQENGITGSKIGIVLTAMSVTTVLFRPFAGYILDNFNRYYVYLLFLALFSLSFLGFAMISVFGLLVLIRLYMGVVYSVCGSATMTLAGDVLPKKKVGPGINRFALTNSLGMAVGPFIGIQVQNIMSSKASFITLFVLTLVALFCVSRCKIEYPSIKRKKFKLSDAFYKPAVPFMLNMIFLMIPLEQSLPILLFWHKKREYRP